MVYATSKRKKAPQQAHQSAPASKKQVKGGTPKQTTAGVPLFLKSASATPSIQRAELKDTSKLARKKLTFAYYSGRLADLKVKQYFEQLSDGRWGTRNTIPKGLTIELSGINSKFITPMASVAMELASITYASPLDGTQKSYFGQNKVISVHLNLKKHGLADGTYRFAWVATKKNPTVYISGPPAAAKALSTATESKGTISAEGAKFTYTGYGWNKDKKTLLLRAIALTPPKALKRITGINFILTTAAPSAKGEDGTYSEGTHTITIHTSAFTNDARALWTLTHEMGHAADLTALREAWDTKNVGTIKRARSETGSRWKKSGDWAISNRALSSKSKRADTAFIKAAIADGIGILRGATILKQGLTEYSNTNWLELYAETYALFVTDPNTLELLRPKTYAYFKNKFM